MGSFTGGTKNNGATGKLKLGEEESLSLGYDFGAGSIALNTEGDLALKGKLPVGTGVAIIGGVEVNLITGEVVSVTGGVSVGFVDVETKIEGCDIVFSVSLAIPGGVVDKNLQGKSGNKIGYEEIFTLPDCEAESEETSDENDGEWEDNGNGEWGEPYYEEEDDRWVWDWIPDDEDSHGADEIDGSDWDEAYEMPDEYTGCHIVFYAPTENRVKKSTAPNRTPWDFDGNNGQNGSVISRDVWEFGIGSGQYTSRVFGNVWTGGIHRAHFFQGQYKDYFIYEQDKQFKSPVFLDKGLIKWSSVLFDLNSQTLQYELSPIYGGNFPIPSYFYYTINSSLLKTSGFSFSEYMRLKYYQNASPSENRFGGMSNNFAYVNGGISGYGLIYAPTVYREVVGASCPIKIKITKVIAHCFCRDKLLGLTEKCNCKGVFKKPRPSKRKQDKKRRKRKYLLPPRKKMDNCCKATLAILAEIYEVLNPPAVKENTFPKRWFYPGEPDGYETFKGYPGIAEALLRMIDKNAFIPFKVKMEDVNPSKKGNQSEEYQFNNLSAVLKTLLEIVFDVEGDGDATNNMLVRLAYEATLIHQILAVVERRTQNTAEFLGYEVQAEEQLLPMMFDPYAGSDGSKESIDENSEEAIEKLIPKLCQETDHPIRVDRNVQRQDLLELLLQITNILQANNKARRL